MLKPGKYRLHYLLILLFLVLGATEHAFAQRKPTVKRKHPGIILADKHYNLGEFYLAAQEYGKVLKSDSSDAYAMFQISECYRQYFDYKKAEKFYKKVVDRFKKDYPLARFWYATMLKDNGEYEKAIVHFNLYRDEHSETDLETELYREKAYQEIKGCELAIEKAKEEHPQYGFKCLPAPVNSPQGEFSPVIFEHDSSLIITSSRGLSKGGTDKTLGGKFTDQYRFFKKHDTLWHMEHKSQHADAFGVLNTAFNEVSGSITSDRKKFYFTRCDEKIKIENNYEEYNCAIYVSYFNNGTWGKPTRLNSNVNTENTWNSQPSVSPDGNILFFVSKRPGGLGMHDIWYSTCNGDDSWGVPINLGDKINTLFMDMSPRYYADQKVLFFSSNGHGGFGGLDIFLTKEEDGFAEIINLGPPFNSNRDDFYFVLGETKGYINSNREGGVGNYDIYTFAIENKSLLMGELEKDTAKVQELLAANNKPIEQKIGEVPANTQEGTANIEGRIIDSTTNKPLANVKIKLKTLSSYVTKEVETNADGTYKIENVPVNEPQQLFVENKTPKQTKIVTTTPSIIFKPAVSKDPVAVKDPVVKDPVVKDPVVKDPVVKDPVIKDPVVKDPVIKDPVVKDPVVKQPVKQLKMKEIQVMEIPGDTLKNVQSITIKGKVFNSTTNKPSAGTTLVLVDKDGVVKRTMKTDAEGNYKLENFVPANESSGYKIMFRNTVQEDHEFDVLNSKVYYQPKQNIPPAKESVIARFSTKEIHPDAQSVNIEGRLLQGNNDETKKPAGRVTVLLVDKTGKTVKTTQTNDAGDFKFNNLKHGDYTVILQNTSAKGGENKPYSVDYVHLKGSDAAVSKKPFDNIFFDFGSEELRPEAKKTLDELAEYCKSNPSAQIEMYSNTDSYGSPEYNKLLAARRGNKAMDYLIGKGVNRTSLVVNAVGEGNAIASNETELGRQMNRRIEFYVLGGSAYEAKTVTYIIEPKKTLTTLARENGMTVDEIKELNGLAGNDLVAFKPLRLRRMNGVDGHFAAPSQRDRFKSKAEMREIENLVKTNKEVNQRFDPSRGEYKRLSDSAAYADRNNAIRNTNAAAVMAENADQEVAYYIVQPKNTLHTIAKLYGTTVEDLKSINGFSSDTIFVNQSVKIDFARQMPNLPGYRVKEGDTLYGISSRFGVSISDLIDINNLDGYVLRKNMVLRLAR